MTAQMVLDLMGKGHRLRVSRANGAVGLWEFSHGAPGAMRFVGLVPRDVFRSLKQSSLIHQLTELGEPPPAERKPGEGYRMGWREAGLDGENGDWWVCTQ